MREFGQFIEGQFQNRGYPIDVMDPDDNGIAGRARLVTNDEMERAISHAVHTFDSFSSLPMYERANLLDRAASILEKRVEEVAETIRREAGKPILLSRFEASRAVSTLRMSANAARELTGKFRNMDGYSQGKEHTTLIHRYPIGPIAAISPFNFPLNLVMHKLAPALALGCPVVHKPARKTPLSPHILAEILLEAGMPEGAYQILVSPPDVAERLATDDRLKLLTFTGSSEVGWHLKSIAGRKRTVLELGGNASAIVEEDADLSLAAQKIATGAYAYSGQICISVQRILAHKAIYKEFKKHLIAAIQEHVKVGKTTDPSVIVGPMISGPEADRVESWVGEAIDQGANSLTKQQRDGNTLWPMLLENAPPSSKVVAREVFGPVAVLAPYDNLDQAIAMTNDSEYGLQAGIFTTNIKKAFQAFEQLEVGGVVLNSTPTTRLDHMPYGGVKASGEGRESPLSAFEHMTEERILLMVR